MPNDHPTPEATPNIPAEMPQVLRITSAHTAGLTAEGSSVSVKDALRNALAELPRNARVVICLHGHEFAPNNRHRNPHETIFAYHAATGAWQKRSWLRLLTGNGAQSFNALVIPYAWGQYTGRRSVMRKMRDGYASARAEAHRLADLMTQISQVAPEREIDILCHGMGARVALQSLPLSGAQHLGRVIMLGGIEYGVEALHAIRSATSSSVEFYNITARQNRLETRIFERYVPRTGRANRAIGHSYPFASPNWIDIQIDDIKKSEALGNIGHPLRVSAGQFHPHSFFANPELFSFCRAVFERQSGLSPAQLEQRLIKPIAPTKPRKNTLRPLRLMRRWMGYGDVRG